MLFNDQQLLSCLHGCIDTENVNGYTVLHRFTKKQRDYYQTTQFKNRERSSSGIFFECVTDAEAIRFDYLQTVSTSQKFYFFDLCINGKYCRHQGSETFTDGETGVYEEKLPKGTNTIRLYFPVLTCTGVRNFQLVNASFFEPVAKNRNYLAYGDSITQGYTSKESALTYANLLAAKLDADLYDLGIGGEFFQPNMLDEQYPVEADLVTVAYGTNDWSKLPADDACIRMKEFLNKLCKLHAGAKIFVILPIWRGPEGESRIAATGTLEDYREILRKEAGNHPEITVIEGIDLVPHHGDFYVSDLLHPNALGFTQYAENLFKEIIL